jgi:hypothetical protein
MRILPGNVSNLLEVAAGHGDIFSKADAINKTLKESELK